MFLDFISIYDYLILIHTPGISLHICSKNMSTCLKSMSITRDTISVRLGLHVGSQMAQDVGMV